MPYLWALILDIYTLSKILLVEKDISFKLRQAHGYGIESYQKNTNMNILCVEDTKLISSFL